MAIDLCLTSFKGVSSMKLHRGLNITQKSAWHLAHRLRKALESTSGMFSGPVEVDETYMGGKRRNMSNAKRKELTGTGHGAVAKVAVVAAKVVESTDKSTLQGFISEHTASGTTVYTDEASAYEGMPFGHESVKHRVAECVRGIAHTNGMESFWSMLKRAHMGNVPKAVSEAFRPLRHGICGPAQHAR